MKLIKSKVTFREEPHGYTTPDGKELSGITSIIGKYICPRKYDGVNQEILERAKQYGTLVHSQLELSHLGFDNAEFTDSTKACIKLIKDNGLKQIAAEYTVSDDDLVATNIDAVFEEDKNVVSLMDYKTTSYVDDEYLQWQLSICAFLFEFQNPHLKVGKLYCAWIPRPKDGEDAKAELIEYGRISNDNVCALLNAFADGKDTFDNPLHKSDSYTEGVINQIGSIDSKIAELKFQIKELENKRSLYAEHVKSVMDASGQSKIENSSWVVTRKKDSVRRSFSLDLFIDNNPTFPQKWKDAIDKTGYKETIIAGGITLKQISKK